VVCVHAHQQRCGLAAPVPLLACARLNLGRRHAAPACTSGLNTPPPSLNAMISPHPAVPPRGTKPAVAPPLDSAGVRTLYHTRGLDQARAEPDHTRARLCLDWPVPGLDRTCAGARSHTRTHSALLLAALPHSTAAGLAPARAQFRSCPAQHVHTPLSAWTCSQRRQRLRTTVLSLCRTLLLLPALRCAGPRPLAGALTCPAPKFDRAGAS
jgi:hypothetical protein